MCTKNVLIHNRAFFPFVSPSHFHSLSRILLLFRRQGDKETSTLGNTSNLIAQKCLQQIEVPWCWHHFDFAHFCTNPTLHEYTIISHLYRVQGNISTSAYAVCQSNQGLGFPCSLFCVQLSNSFSLVLHLLCNKLLSTNPYCAMWHSKLSLLCFYILSHAFCILPFTHLATFTNYYFMFISICFYYLHVNKNIK